VIQGTKEEIPETKATSSTQTPEQLVFGNG
jgi:hypothetical protein